MDDSKVNSNYTPIACADYDIYEIAIMYRQTLELVWLDDEGTCQQDMVVAKDLKIIDGAEFLIAQRISDVAAKPLMIRLDKIRTVKSQLHSKTL